MSQSVYMVSEVVADKRHFNICILPRALNQWISLYILFKDVLDRKAFWSKNLSFLQQKWHCPKVLTHDLAQKFENF